MVVFKELGVFEGVRVLLIIGIFLMGVLGVRVFCLGVFRILLFFFRWVFLFSGDGF